jgi:hypothetical protein
MPELLWSLSDFSWLQLRKISLLEAIVGIMSVGLSEPRTPQVTEIARRPQLCILFELLLDSCIVPAYLSSP